MQAYWQEVYKRAQTDDDPAPMTPPPETRVIYAGEYVAPATLEAADNVIFLMGITLLGPSSWRPKAIARLLDDTKGTNTWIISPEPRDSKIIDWATFYKTQAPGYSQIRWETYYSYRYATIFSMWLPAYLDEKKAGPFVVDLGNGSKRSNTGNQVRIEAGILYERLRSKHPIRVIWGAPSDASQVKPFLEMVADLGFAQDVYEMKADWDKNELVPDVMLEALAKAAK